MKTLNICRTCLITDVKMFKLNTPFISTTYFELTGITDLGAHQVLCYECIALVKKFYSFRSKCLLSDETLRNCLVTNKEIEKYRSEKKLESHLKCSETLVHSNQEPIVENLQEIESVNLENIKVESEELKTELSTTDLVNTNYNSDNDIYDTYNESLSDIETEQLPATDKPTNLKVPKSLIENKKVIKRRSSVSSEDEPLHKLRKKKLIKKKKVLKVRQRREKFTDSYFEGYTTVAYMTPEEAKQEVDSRKQTSNYKNCAHKCELCYRGFDAEITFKNHMKKHTSLHGECECDYCHLRFPTRTALSKHIFSCHKRKFTCIICPYVCFGGTQARVHMDLHRGIKYKCDICEEIFSMPNTLLMHIRVKHPTEQVCSICGSTFAKIKGLNAHMKFVHKSDTNNRLGPYCAVCEVHFSTEVAYKRHRVLSAKHDDVRNGCDKCGETYKTEEELKVHYQTHKKIRKKLPEVQQVLDPVNCSICNKWLKNNGAYTCHMKISHPRAEATERIRSDEDFPCVCEVCGKRFKKNCFLVYHQRKHTGERPYSCSICGKTYAFPGTLSTHRKMHSEKMHNCQLCEKTFKYKTALNKHVKATHLNMRPHKCSVCGKSFPNPCEVKYHMQHVHCKVPWPKRDRSKRKIAQVKPNDYNIEFN